MVEEETRNGAGGTAASQGAKNDASKESSSANEFPSKFVNGIESFVKEAVSKVEKVTAVPASKVEQVATETAARVRDEAKAFQQDMRASIKQAHMQRTGESRDVYEEAASALFPAIALYGYAHLRQLARQPCLKLKGNQASIQAALEPPACRLDIIKTFEDNIDVVKDDMPNTELYMSAIESLIEDLRISKLAAKVNPSQLNGPKTRRSSILRASLGMDDTQQAVIDPVTIVVMDDEYAATELVYVIALDSERETIKLTFRGSVTIRDWAADGDSFMTTHQNKILDSETNRILQARYVGIHRGFYNYMFGKQRGNPRCKFEVIHSHIQRILKENPTYYVDVTGHSLGAALATLFTFWSAFDNRFSEIGQWPIRCVVFASPRVGNEKFFRAFYELKLQRENTFSSCV
jgi:hypothetical protein